MSWARAVLACAMLVPATVRAGTDKFRRIREAEEALSAQLAQFVADISCGQPMKAASLFLDDARIHEGGREYVGYTQYASQVLVPRWSLGVRSHVVASGATIKADPWLGRASARQSIIVIQPAIRNRPPARRKILQSWTFEERGNVWLARRLDCQWLDDDNVRLDAKR